MVAKNGPKIKSVPEDEIFKLGQRDAFAVDDAPGITCCFINAKMTMPMLAGLVQHLVGNGGPVMDMTGLMGAYDIRLSLNSLPRQPGLGVPGARGGGGGDQLREPRDFDPPLLKALEQQIFHKQKMFLYDEQSLCYFWR